MEKLKNQSADDKVGLVVDFVFRFKQHHNVTFQLTQGQ